MKIRTKALLALGILIVVIGSFAFHSYRNFRIAENFTPVPLSFNPTDSTSAYDWHGSLVKIQGGFVKGTIGVGNSNELLLRSLTPTPKIALKGGTNPAKNQVIRLENINPVNIQVKNLDQPFKIIDAHTISFTVNLRTNEEKTIEVFPKDDKDYLEFVILGDNRDGYQTFANILDQINSIKPVFAIDNGDLVFGGEPNRYRLFNQTVARLQVPLYTTLGNHDIRENGRPTYTKLFGPPYYSFDYRDAHFVFLDSSRGWAEKRTIPEEQYQWLENDLRNAQGKRIFVISHIPSSDPRTGKQPNTLPDIPGIQETSFFDRLMSDYSKFKDLDHAFPDKQEAKRFEDLMSKYKVNTVFLSHIHSYFSFLKGGVRYIISGGGGAELLTKDSYYHFIRVKVQGDENYLEVVQLPSPPNQLQDRYLAAAQMFAAAIYKEYTTIVWIIAVISAVLIAWIVWISRKKWWPGLKLLGTWFIDTVKFARFRFKELRGKKE